MTDPETLYQLQFVSDPQISNDDHLVTFVVTRVEDERPAKGNDQELRRKVYCSSIWLSRDSAPAVQFTAGTYKDTAPRFSPDGSYLAFLSDRPVVGLEQRQSQLFVVPTNGGEARALTRLTSGVSEPRWSPDGSRIAFLSRGDFEDLHIKNGTPYVIERLRYKANGSPKGLRSDEPLQLWVLDIDSHEARAITRHPCDIEEFDWLPDSSGIVFIAPRDEDQAGTWHSNAFLVQLAGGEVTQLTDWSGPMSNLAVSPDGLKVAVVGDPLYSIRPGDYHLYVFQLTDAVKAGEQFSSLERLDSHFDYHATNTVNADSHFGVYPGGPVWLEDGSLLMLYTLGGAGAICGITLAGDVWPLVQEPGANIAAFQATSRGRIVLLRETNAALCDVYLWREGATRQLSHVSEAALTGIELTSDLDHIQLERDGFTVEGWLLRPVDWREGEQYPVILSIHGGPATAYGHAYFHEFQLFASHGYAVLFGNIRGSTGYGEAQTAGTQGWYGTGDYDDLMALLDSALDRYPWLDRTRQCVMGGSYGGIMTNWIIGHTERFKVAVTDRSICNWVSLFGTSDIGYNFVLRELRGDVPDAVERLWEMSPLKYVRNVTTPCLIVHSEEDHRTPIEQAEQWFVALKRQGVPTRFVRIPVENHDLSRTGQPDRRVFRLREYLAWLEMYL